MRQKAPSTMPDWDEPPTAVAGTLITAGHMNALRDSILGATKMLYMVGSNGVNQTSGQTIFYGLQGNSASESNVEDVLSVPKTAQNLRMFLPGSPGSGQTFIATLRKNGADTALTVTISEPQATGEDAVNSVSFAANDRICIKVVTSGSANSRQPHLCSELI